MVAQLRGSRWRFEEIAGPRFAARKTEVLRSLRILPTGPRSFVLGLESVRFTGMRPEEIFRAEGAVYVRRVRLR